MTFTRTGFARGLALAFGVVLLALAGAAAYTWLHLDSIADANRDAASRLVPQLARVGAIELNITRVSLQARHAMLVSTPEDLKATLDDIGAKRKLIDEALAAFGQDVRSAKGKELLAVAQTRATDFWKEGEANLGMTAGGRKDEAFAHLTRSLIPARERLLAAVTELRSYQQELLAGLVATSETEARTTKLVQAAMMTLTALVLVSTGVLLARAIRERTAEAGRAAQAIAAGDLSQTIDVRGGDEFVPMLRQMNAMQASLRAIVGQVRASSEHIASASAEIATGNQDLSGRTEQAASSLQQTASSMHQLTDTVRQTAEAARQANQLAATAAEVASRGGEVVARVVSTMDEISGSSRRIADIIGVIDGIAFQTNILALNAAVEAARAGEQGRGFAVVAGEVRTLAQRSADAAREIKALIGSSVDKVETGGRLVADAGKTMSELVGSVQRVSDIIGEISSAASEQSDGIGQVNGAVTNLDEMTQRNAALVEQASAAAGSLREQAARMTQLVSTFSLGSAASA